MRLMHQGSVLPMLDCQRCCQWSWRQRHPLVSWLSCRYFHWLLGKSLTDKLSISDGPFGNYHFDQNWLCFSQCICAYATNVVFFVKTAVSMVDAAPISFCPIFAHAAFWPKWTEKSTSKTIKIVNCSQALAHNSYSSPIKLTHFVRQLQFWVEIHCENFTL